MEEFPRGLNERRGDKVSKLLVGNCMYRRSQPYFDNETG
jgi:hypothetical protein